MLPHLGSSPVLSAWWVSMLQVSYSPSLERDSSTHLKKWYKDHLKTINNVLILKHHKNKRMNTFYALPGRLVDLGRERQLQGTSHIWALLEELPLGLWNAQPEPWLAHGCPSGESRSQIYPWDHDKESTPATYQCSGAYCKQCCDTIPKCVQRFVHMVLGQWGFVWDTDNYLLVRLDDKETY